MTIGQIFGQTFRIYKYNFLRLLAIITAIQVPIFLLARLIHLADFSACYGIIPGLVITFLGILALNLCVAGLAGSVSGFYLGRKTGVIQAYRCVLKNFGRILLVSLLVQLVLTLGFVLLIVPGIIFGLWYAVIAPVIVIENLRPVKGMRRSKKIGDANLFCD